MMTKHYLLAVSLLAAPFMFNSCSTLTSLTSGVASLAGADISNLPGIGPLMEHQNALIAQYSAANIKLLESQKACYDAFGEHSKATELDKEIQHLQSDPNSDSVMNASDLARDNAEDIKERFAALTSQEGIRTAYWKDSVVKLNEAIVLEGQMAADCAIRSAALISALKGQDNIKKALIIAQFRPIIYFVCNLPSDYELYRSIQDTQERASNEFSIPYPKMPAAPKIDFSELASSGVSSMLGI